MVMLSSVMLGQGAPCMEALAAARGVAFTVFNIIDKVRVFLIFHTMSCSGEEITRLSPLILDVICFVHKNE